MTNSPVTYDGLAQVAVITSSVPGAISDVRYNGSTVLPTNAGSYTVTVVFTPSDTLNYTSLLPGQAGNFVIVKATPTRTVTNSPVAYDGLPHAAVVTSTVAGVVSNIHYNGSATIPTKPGTYVVAADFICSDPNYADLVDASAGNFVIPALIYLPLILR